MAVALPVQQEVYHIDARDLTPAKRRNLIVRTFTKYGLSLLFREGGLAIFRNGGVNLSEDQQARLGTNIRRCFEALGPTFIKLGQVLATRSDFLPEFICDELTLLLDAIPPVPFGEVAAVLEAELPEGMRTFRRLDPQPLGSASLACVYKAELRDGRPCAVKVVRPNVEKLFQTDIALIKGWARRLSKLLPPPLAAAFDLNGLLDDYYSSSLAETDMRQEAQHMEDHRVYMAEYDHLRVPKVYLKPTKNVLVQELVDGWSIKEFPVDFLTLEDRAMLMNEAAHYYIKTIMEGYYHADFHASNLLVGRDKQLYAIDWGMVGHVDTNLTETILKLVSYVFTNRISEAAEVALQVMRPTEYTDMQDFKQQFVSHAEKYAWNVQGDTKANWGTMVMEFIQVSASHYCKVPSGLALWAKGWSATEAVARWLLPEYSYARSVETFDTNLLEIFLQHHLSFRTNGFAIFDVVKMLTALPQRINVITEQLADGTLTLRTEHRLTPATARTVNAAVNRVVLGAIVCALFITSGLFAIAMQGTAHTVAWIWMGSAATICAVAGAVLGIWTLWRLRRTSKS